MIQSMIAILDLGGKDNASLAREIRSLGVYSEIFPHDIEPEALKAKPGIAGVILNGGENRVVDGAPIDVDAGIFSLGLKLISVDHSSPAHSADLSAWGDDRRQVLDKFIDECGAKRNWSVENFVADQIELIRMQVRERNVLLALSGGVDSSVVAALLIKAIGDKLTCVHVNHGLLRKGEPEQVVKVFREQFGAKLIYVDASERYLKRLENVSDPEQKRIIIGAEFVDIFAEEASKLALGDMLLAQGTIYPDIVESGTKTAKKIKSHHNWGAMPKDHKFELIEPLKMLFKDEVRAVGRALGLPDSMVNRQPFPGPGLGVRCLGAITRERLEIVRESDAILREEFKNAGLEGKVWQYFTVVPDIKSTGIRNDARALEYPVIIRAVHTIDAMTATIAELPWPLIHKIAERITTEVPGANRVLYDLSPKPPATIEWE